jgi:hypothetical protein
MKSASKISSAEMETSHGFQDYPVSGNIAMHPSCMDFPEQSFISNRCLELFNALHDATLSFI